MNEKTKAQLAEASKVLDAKREVAKTAWADLETVRAKAAKSPTDLLTPGSDIYNELDTAGVAYDGLCDEINDMEAQFNRVGELLGAEAPKSAAKLPGDTLRPGSRAEEIVSAAVARNIDNFMESFLAWRETTGIMVSPQARFGQMPPIKLFDKNDFRAATVSMPDFPSQPTRRPGVTLIPTETLELLDVIPMVPVTTDAVEYVYEATYTRSTAVEKAEGSAAGEGVLHYDKATVNCVWIPFTIPATKQLLTDEGRMRSFVQNRIGYGVRSRLQNQLINGAGDGENLLGIVDWPNILTHTSGADHDYPFDVVHKAMTDIRIATKRAYNPNVIFMNDEDYEIAILAKDANYNYYFGGPAADGARTIWGLRPIVHPDITSGSPIVCDINAAECYVRQDVTLSVTDSNEDHFVKGIIDFLAEGRWGFAILQASAFCEIQNFDS